METISLFLVDLPSSFFSSVQYTRTVQTWIHKSYFTTFALTQRYFLNVFIIIILTNTYNFSFTINMALESFLEILSYYKTQMLYISHL